MKILFAVRIGNEDWQEQLITENEHRIEAASAWARENGFDRLRIAEIDLSAPLDFGSVSMLNPSAIDQNIETLHEILTK